MSRFAAGLAGMVRRAGLGPRSTGRDRPDRQARYGWRTALDDSLLRRLERLSLVPQRAASGGAGGEHRSRARAASTDFVDYRPYLPGDDFRQIDWNAYGRLDQLFVKLTEARERIPLQLLVDCSASMDAGEPNKLDYSRQLAAAIGYVALARFDRVEIAAMGNGPISVRSLRGKQQFGELVSFLDGLEAGGMLHEGDLAAFRPRASGGQAVLISDMLMHDGYSDGLAALASAGLTPSVIQVLSPQELRPSEGGDYELRDVETGEVVQVGLSPDAIDEYRRRLDDWCDGLERFCLQRGLRYVRVCSSDGVERALLIALRRARILA